jgi:hypothetical protein
LPNYEMKMNKTHQMNTNQHEQSLNHHKPINPKNNKPDEPLTYRKDLKQV